MDTEFRQSSVRMDCVCSVMCRTSMGKIGKPGVTQYLGAGITWKRLHQHAEQVRLSVIWDLCEHRQSEHLHVFHVHRASPKHGSLQGAGLLPAGPQASKHECPTEMTDAALSFMIYLPMSHPMLFLVKAVTNLPKFKDRGRAPKNYLANIRTNTLFWHPFARWGNRSTERERLFTQDPITYFQSWHP